MRALTLLLALLASPALAQAPITLPGGASALTETHGDWTVQCAVDQSTIVCAVRQEQLDPGSNQRLLAIELSGDQQEMTGTLVLPFGLALERGVLYQVDEGSPQPLLRFRTCLPAGCVISLDLGADVVGALRNGQAINLTAVADAGGDVPFTVSLKGFGSALDRAVTLGR